MELESNNINTIIKNINELIKEAINYNVNNYTKKGEKIETQDGYIYPEILLNIDYNDNFKKDSSTQKQTMGMEIEEETSSETFNWNSLGDEKVEMEERLESLEKRYRRTLEEYKKAEPEKQLELLEKQQHLLEKQLELLNEQFSKIMEEYGKATEEQKRVLYNQANLIAEKRDEVEGEYNRIKNEIQDVEQDQQFYQMGAGGKAEQMDNDEDIMEIFLDHYMPNMLFIISTYRKAENNLMNVTVIKEIENIVRDYIILNLINFCKIKHDGKGYKDISTEIYKTDNILLPSKNGLSKSLHEQFEKLAQNLNDDLFKQLKQKETRDITNDIFKVCISTKNQRIANSRNKVFQTINNQITNKIFALCLDDSDFIGFFNYNGEKGNFIKSLLEYKLLSGELDTGKGLSFRFGESNKGQHNYGGSIVSFWTKIFLIESLKNFKNNVADVGEDGPTLYSYLPDKENVSNNVIRLKNLFNDSKSSRKGYPVYINYSENMNPHYNAPIPIIIKYELDGKITSMFITFDYLHTYPNGHDLKTALQREYIEKINIIENKTNEKEEDVEEYVKKNEIKIMKNILPPYEYYITDNITEKIFGYPLAKIISNHPLDEKIMINGYDNSVLTSLDTYDEFYTFLNGNQIGKMNLKGINNKKDLLNKRNYLGTKIYVLRSENLVNLVNDEEFSNKLIHNINIVFVLNYKIKNYLELVKDKLIPKIISYVESNEFELKNAYEEYISLDEDGLKNAVKEFLVNETGEKIIESRVNKRLEKTKKKLEKKLEKPIIIPEELKEKIEIEEKEKYLKSNEKLESTISDYIKSEGLSDEAIEEYVKNRYIKLALILLNNKSLVKFYNLNTYKETLKEKIKLIRSYFKAKERGKISKDDIETYKIKCSIIESNLLEKQTLPVYYLGSNSNITFNNIEFIQRLMWNNYKEKTCGNIPNYSFYGSNLMNTINNFFKKQWILCLLLICIIVIVVIIIIVVIKKRKIINKNKIINKY